MKPGFWLKEGETPKVPYYCEAGAAWLLTILPSGEVETYPNLSNWQLPYGEPAPENLEEVRYRIANPDLVFPTFTPNIPNPYPSGEIPPTWTPVPMPVPYP